jgi:poly-beta-1,6-N-acetyl-D-glucosamine synthase
MFTIEITPFIMLCFSVICLLVLLFYYFYFFTQLNVSAEPTSELRPISVIVAARNEKKNLEHYLELLLTQDYPEYEVVVINDGSHDGSKLFLKELEEKYVKLKIVTLELDERFQKGKKFALTMGIKASKYEYLLFTDADCWPTSKNWISKMNLSFQDKDMVLGVAPLEVQKSILGSVIKYETFHTALQYLTYANRGFAYMGVGRNLAYTKTLFFKNKGFASHQHILSGDDDLFVQENVTLTNLAICIDQDSFMYSKAPITFRKWLTQKKRHFSTNKAYKGKFIRLLGLYSFAQLGLYISLVACVITMPNTWFIPLGIIVLKWIVQWAIMLKPTKVLNADSIRWGLPYYDILYTVFLFFFAIIKPFIRQPKWS